MAKKNTSNTSTKNGKKGAKAKENRTSSTPRKSRPGMKKTKKVVVEKVSMKDTDKYMFVYGDKKEVLDSSGKKVELHRIKALRTFGIGKNKVKKGTLGGYIIPGSLSQKGTCWVKQDCMVLDKAEVKGNAVLEKGAKATGKCIVMGDVRLTGPIHVDGMARISGSTTLISKKPELVVKDMCEIGTFLFTREGLKKIR